jgi:hypothetical protein
MLPSYFSANNWSRQIYYAVSKTALDAGGGGCKTCIDPSLSIDGVSGYDVILMTPGYAGAARPSANLTDYVDDRENQNNDDVFVTPVSIAADRDRLYPIVSATADCSHNARVLVENVPCGAPGGVTRPACQSAALALNACTCAPAANAMMKPPCSSALSSAGCQSAVALLRACVL